MVYEYALGCNALHIARSITYKADGSSKACFSSCICIVKQWHGSGYGQFLQPDICRFEPDNLRLHLSLLRCCSQVYMEAALIPFTHNTFSFADAVLLPQFLSTLVPAQATAITSLALNNIFAGDLLEQEYWYGLPELHRLSVTIRGHAGCFDDGEHQRDYRRFNDLYISDARMAWEDDPSHEPLEHFNLKSFKLRIVCACGVVLEDCPTQRDWQQWAESIEIRVSARRYRRRHERRQGSGRQLLQIQPLDRAIPVQTPLGNCLGRFKGWYTQYLLNWKRSLVDNFLHSMRSETRFSSLGRQ
jgi:hypothetical protein